jgi:hypothetical protein
METTFGGETRPTGELSLRVTRDLGNLKTRRKAPLSWKIKNFVQHRLKEIPQYPVLMLGYIPGVVVVTSKLSLKKFQRNEDGTITEIDYGVVGRKMVTTVGVNFIVDAFQNITEPENMKYHGFGTGGAAEAVGNTALTTEETTQYVSDNNRPTGSTTEGASANIYRTVGTYSPDSGGTRAITEHGIFDQASNAGGVLLDRTLFSVVNLVAAADSLQATYELTFTAGS